MIFSYGIACIPMVVGGILYARRKEVTFWEWGLVALMGFLTAVAFNFIAIMGMTSDTETWSGQVNRVVWYPTWVEHVHYTYTTTDSDGDTQTHTVDYYTTHPEHWEAEDTLYQSIGISKEQYQTWSTMFGGYTTEHTYKSGFSSGDPNIYPATNKNDIVIPTTCTKTWENRVKAAPSLFSFRRLTGAEKSSVFAYPRNDVFESGRLLGTAKGTVSLLEFDMMNAALGPNKKVNVILIGFGDKDASIVDLQQALWVGGKKNDLVLCYGGPNEKPTWARVFGWTDEETCKRNLETILLTHPVNNQLLPLISKEVVENYRIKDWSRFDYITVEPPLWSYFVLVFVMAATQGGLYWYALKNDINKEASRG